MRLFCLPYAGGSSREFRGWTKALPGFVEVCPVELPGRGRRMGEPCYTRLLELVGAISKGLAPYLDVPFAFFGHSMGAILAFELARTLRREHGCLPRCLFVSGRRAPQLPDSRPSPYALLEHEFIDEVRKLNGTPREVLEHRELMEVMLPILRADFELVRSYEYSYEFPLECRIIAFGGKEDDEETREKIEPWRQQTTGGFSLRMLPGDHFFVESSQSLLLHLVAHEVDKLRRAWMLVP